MKSKTYTPEQIVQLVRQAEAGQAEGRTVEEMCRTPGIGDSTCHRWTNQYAGPPGRLPTNLVAGAPKASEKADPRRRAMTGGELTRPPDVARQRPLLDAMTVRRGARKGGGTPTSAPRRAGGWSR